MKDRLMRLTHGILNGDEEVLQVEWDLAPDGSPRLCIRYSNGEEVQFHIVSNSIADPAHQPDRRARR